MAEETKTHAVGAIPDEPPPANIVGVRGWVYQNLLSSWMDRILTVVAQGDELEAHSKVVPLVAHKVARKGQATAYVCEKRVCELPTTEPDVFAKQLVKK